jgi:hypothetical protein
MWAEGGVLEKWGRLGVCCNSLHTNATACIQMRPRLSSRHCAISNRLYM